MAGFRVEGNTSGNVAEVDTSNQLKVALSNTPAAIGGVRNFSENDPGGALGSPLLVSPEVDSEFRLRVGNDMILDEESFSYTAQNFTKHRLDLTTFTSGFSTAGWNSNPGNGITTGSSSVLRTYKTFSMFGTETLSLDAEVAINYASGATLPANQTLELGFGLLTQTTPFDSFDSIVIRLNSSGAYGILRNNSTTDVASTAAFNDSTGTAWVPVSGRRYQFIIYQGTREIKIWINDPVTNNIWLAGALAVPAGYGMPLASPAASIFFRHTISGTSAIVASMSVSRYSVRRGGTNIATTLNVLAARAGDSIYSPGTLTTTQGQTVTTGSIVRPTAAVPTNTTSTLTSLGGIYVETGTLALATDAILMSYQVPALPVAVATTYTQQRRLRIDGVIIASGVTTAFATGGFQKHFYIAYGSTALSLAGVAVDTATTKAYRRFHLPIVQYYTATHAPGAPNNAPTYYALQAPIFVNPGEFVALVTYHQGVVGTTGVITHALQFDHSWE